MDNQTNRKPDNVPYIVHESESARAERHIKRLIIALVICIALLFISNMIWLHEWTAFDFTKDTITVDSNDGGNANYVGEDGDITNGESKSEQNTDDQTQREK